MSKTATYLYREMIRQGFTLTVQGSQLLVSPSSRLTDPLRQQIRENKTSLMWLVKLEAAPNVVVDDESPVRLWDGKQWVEAPRARSRTRRAPLRAN